MKTIIFYGLLLAGCGNSTEIVGLDGFGKVESALFFQHENIDEGVDAYLFSDSELEHIGNINFDPISISSNPHTCSDTREDFSMRESLLKALLDALDGGTDLAGACSEMTEIQAHFDELRAKNSYPIHNFGIGVETFVYENYQTGSFDVNAYYSQRQRNCGKRWDGDSCAFLPSDCTESDTSIVYMQGRLDLDKLTTSKAEGVFSGVILEGEQEGTEVEVNLDLDVCEISSYQVVLY